MKKMAVHKVPVAKPLMGKGKTHPRASHPHFKRPKMSVMGRSAYGTPAMAGGGAPAFPAPPPNPDMGGGAAPMPAGAMPDNIGG